MSALKKMQDKVSEEMACKFVLFFSKRWRHLLYKKDEIHSDVPGEAVILHDVCAYLSVQEHPVKMFQDSYISLLIKKKKKKKTLLESWGLVSKVLKLNSLHRESIHEWESS